MIYNFPSHSLFIKFHRLTAVLLYAIRPKGQVINSARYAALHLVPALHLFSYSFNRFAIGLSTAKALININPRAANFSFYSP